MGFWVFGGGQMETESWLPQPTHPTHSSAREGCLHSTQGLSPLSRDWLEGMLQCSPTVPPAYQRPSLHQESKVKRQKGAQLAAEISGIVTGRRAWRLAGSGPGIQVISPLDLLFRAPMGGWAGARLSGEEVGGAQCGRLLTFSCLPGSQSCAAGPSHRRGW